MKLHPLQRRKETIERYLKGEKVQDICQAMACSKSFLYKWLHRYNRGHKNWALSHARRPLRNPTRTPDAIAQKIVRLKKELGQNRALSSVPLIQQALKTQGIEPLPSQRTIYRVLARHEKEVGKTTKTS